MAKILIPTRNRPASLGCVLSFLARFYPGSEVVVGDGSSNDDYNAAYRQVIDSFRESLSVDYRPYDADLPFFERILDMLESIDDELVVMGADDDYPILDVLGKGEAFLKDNPDYATAMGSIVHLTLMRDGRMTARLGHARPIINVEADQRAMNHARWPFSTTYAVTRREHLIERYRRARTMFLANFFDFTVGIHDCVMGKFKAYGEIGYFCTRNARHSYVRAKDQLIYLRRGADVLKLVDMFRDDLMKHARRPEGDAQRQADRLIRYRIEELAGGNAFTRPGFASSPLFRDPVVQQQYNDFHGLFTEGHPAREAIYDKLTFIVDALKEQGASTKDNHGEKPTYETLDAQSEGEPALKKATAGIAHG